MGAIAGRAMVLAALGAAGLGVLAPLPALAQPVVQPLPSPAVGALESALRRLAADPRNVQALVDAGYAALALDDADAAIGFFSRASEIAPQNARAKAGLGTAFVRSENPYDAMLLFEEALRLGASPVSLAADRGLAADLVGDPDGAQALYRQALASGPNDEISRRLALSLAVSGKRDDMEQVLLPLLKKTDMAAFRTRAFGLAILGDAKEANDIVDAIMPKEMAKRLKPYLRQLPRLTSAQQVAAASFGHFPAEKDIGSDDPRVARYGGASQAPAQPVRTADATLIPAGEPLGAKGKTGSVAKVEKTPRESRRGRNKDKLAVATEPVRTAPPATARREQQVAAELPPRTVPAAPARATGELAPVSPRPGFSPGIAPSSSPPVASASLEPAAAPAPSSVPASRTAPVFAQVAAVLAPTPAASPASSPASQPAQGVTPASAELAPKSASAPSAMASTSFDLRSSPESRVAASPAVPPPATPVSASLTPTPAPPSNPAPASSTSTAPGMSAPLSSGPAATPIYSPAPATQSAALAQTSSEPAPAAKKFSSVADAFEGFATVTPPVKVLPGAVDLTTIKVAREAPPAPKPDPKAEMAEKAAKEKLAKEKLAKDKAAKEKAAKEKARKANPSRIWVQVGTGRDKGALAFTWRRISKEQAALFKGRQSYVTGWNQTNRLLTGPFPSDAAAKDFLKKLKAANVDSFPFTSAEGQEVESLPGSR